MSKGYDLFGDHGRNFARSRRSWYKDHGSGARPMYGDMGKSCRPDPNLFKIEYPIVQGRYYIAHLTFDSHNTSYFFKENMAHTIGYIVVKKERMMYMWMQMNCN